MKKNKIKLIAIAVGVGAATYFAFRKKKIRFFDYVWCSDSDCTNIEDAIEYCGGRSVETPTQEEMEECVGNTDAFETGTYNLIFSKPHNLKVGEKIFVEQDANAVYSEYDGWTKVATIFNPYIIGTSKARLGSAPTQGGYIYTESLVEKLTGSSED